MTHLGDRASALVDGQLSPEATERAHAHLAHCRGCRDLVELERQMKATLSCLSSPAPGGDLVGRLLALGGPEGPLPPRPGHVPGSPRPVPVAVLGPAPDRAAGIRRRAVPRPAGRPSAAARPSVSASASGTTASRPGGRPASPRRVRLAGAVLGALGVVGAGVGGLLLATPEPSSRVPAQAPIDTLTVQRPLAPRVTVSADVSLELRPNRSFVVHTVDSTGGGG